MKVKRVSKPLGGGYSNYFLTECAARGLKPLSIFKDFSRSKKRLNRHFFRNFRKSRPISKGFSASKTADFRFFFRKFCEMRLFSKEFFDQNGTRG